ncbi:hypothetical protein KV102_12505 [Mumia sp. zg.B53]|uniref:hypothetical protein n=1 Tax=unclassified Mumia TaxID=2621872 RepID=UPI001C6F4479|nr:MULTISPECIES: hypothetical protein [unclassified Mumia]MBW9206615.1 hypothetical protein [Mumia sp. zg.B17]MBW9211095.1 hypothetical protein [Mumia sp. zg.B21]MBW9215663.1 hypothetical protein [Mumia sp. zg.B53]MDD9347854.1 hypothetical protein [Mumia sp.]
MLLPLVSVTVIGIVAGLLLRPSPPVRRSRPRGVAVGVLGAWAGFLVLALLGVVVDVVAGTGTYVALLGHAGAVLGAAAASRS